MLSDIVKDGSDAGNVSLVRCIAVTTMYLEEIVCLIRLCVSGIHV